VSLFQCLLNDCLLTICVQRKLILYEKPDMEKLGITNSMLGYPPPVNYVHPIAVSLPSVDKGV